VSLEWANWYHRRRIANLPCDITGCLCRELNNGYVAHEQHVAGLRAKRAAMPWWRRIFQETT
jgi:hypothetical protein